MVGVNTVEQGEIKRMPREAAVRAAVRAAAEVQAAAAGWTRPPGRAQLDDAGRAVLTALDLPLDFLGFAMVAVSNAFWRAHVAAVPFHRRLLLLPHCLRDAAACAGSFDSEGLTCAGCGGCDLAAVQTEAEALGYTVTIAEGSPTVMMKVLEGEADALLGVACLDSLEHTYATISSLGIPHLAVPLLTDGCTGTTAEMDAVRALLHVRSAEAAPPVTTYLPLLRETGKIFADDALAAVLGTPDADDPLLATDAIAVDWLREGGKRLRPFITVAAYAVGRYGLEALEPDAPVATLLSPAARRVAMAIEVLHKASLVHDDIEDDEAMRYGVPTLHRQYGTGPAINIGDFLVGLGYRLIAAEVEALGPACVRDILAQLAAAHLDLCRGQGAELLWRRQRAQLPGPTDVLPIYALKTAPAFEVALYAGLRMADVQLDAAYLKRLALYVGEAYQLADDVDEWRELDDPVRLARELRCGQPTMLNAFVGEAGGEARLRALPAEPDDAALAAAARDLYESCGAFAQADRLRARLRERALALAESRDEPALRELLTCLVRILLPEPAA